MLRIPGTGLSGSVAGINPTVTQYSAGSNYKFTGESYSYAACTSGFEYEMFTADGMISPGQIAYYDPYGAVPIRGYKYFTYGGGNQIYQILPSTGEIGYGTGDFC